MNKCRFCSKELSHVFANLETSPPSNSYLKSLDEISSEKYFSLKLYVCEQCFLVQVDEEEKATEIFNADYAYFSSFSSTWLKHCKKYCDEITNELSLNNSSFVVEVASNDGYLLQNFVANNIPVLGIEPTESTAKVAIEKGIDTNIEFFGAAYAKSLSLDKKADLIIANNVIAHVPDLNDFVLGFKNLLNEGGTVTVEFPHLLNLIKENQFDTIYHEHFSYFSLITIQSVFKKHGMDIYKCLEVPTHGGSLRIYAGHSNKHEIDDSINKILLKEREAGLLDLNSYLGFQKQVDFIKKNVLTFFKENQGKKIAAYGAAAKGNTLLNYCGIKHPQIAFIVDANPHKQNKFMPASHIPIVDEKELKRIKPDLIIILPWNLKEEITSQLSYARDWGAKFVTFIPDTVVQ